MPLIIYGASDDLIELEGDIREEFNPTDGEPFYIATSNGYVIRVTYDGDWNLSTKQLPEDGEYEFFPAGSPGAVSESGREFSDVIIIEGDISWVVGGERYERG